MKHNINKMRKSVISAIVLLVCITIVSATPPIPESYWGYATLNGAPASYGTSITVEVYDTGEEVGNTTVQYPDGGYSLDLIFDDPDTPEDEGANEGDKLTWKINGIDCSTPTPGTDTATPGGINSNFNLTATSEDNPPSITVLHPNGGESIPIGTQVQVSAHATDDTAVTSVTFSYSNNSGSDWNPIGAGTRFSGTDKDGIWNETWNTNGLGAGSNYLIKAVADDGTAPIEDQSDSTFSLTCTPPSAPTLNDPGTTDTDGSYTVAWSSVSGATNYTLEEDTSGLFGSPTVVYSGSGTSTPITGRSNGTYYYRVKACNACGCGGWSNVEDIEVECAGDIVEFSGEIMRLTDAQTADIIWDKNNFGGFYYDINGGIGTETLIIATGTLAGPNVDRTIETGALTYTTHSIWCEYKLHKNLGLIVDSDHQGGDSGYWIEFWRGEEYVAIEGNTSKLVKPLVEFNSTDVKILETGDPWNLGGGFALEAKQINLAADGVWFCLYKNGIILDDKVIHPSDSNLQERVYTYIQDVAGEDNIPIFSCYVSELYSDQVQIKYVFLIDTNVTEIYIGNEYSIMGVKTISPSAVILKNNMPIDLTSDTTTPLMSNLSLKTTDNTGAIEFYPHIIRKKSHVFSGDGGFIGDLNHDGILTPADAAIALHLATSGSWDPAADMNDDSRITSLDALMILQAAAETQT